MKHQYIINSKLLFLVLMASISSAQAEPFSQECKGLATLLSPVEQGRDGWLNAHFLMHKDTFRCTGDKKEPKLTGYQYEGLQYMNLDIGKPTVGQLLRISYRYSKGVTLGGGGFLNWGIEEPANPTIINDKEKATIKKALEDIKTYIYTGNFFSIKYPKHFTVKTGVLLSDDNSNEQNYSPIDEAYFTSPDKAVEFFVFSPSGVGKPYNYHKVLDEEMLVSEETKKDAKDDVYRNYVVTKWAAMAAKDGSYQRSYVWQRACHDNGVSSFEDCVSHVFGIKYKDKKTYQKYRDDYLVFKKSLDRFENHE